MRSKHHYGCVHVQKQHLYMQQLCVSNKKPTPGLRLLPVSAISIIKAL